MEYDLTVDQHGPCLYTISLGDTARDGSSDACIAYIPCPCLSTRIASLKGSCVQIVTGEGRIVNRALRNGSILSVVKRVHMVRFTPCGLRDRRVRIMVVWVEVVPARVSIVHAWVVGEDPLKGKSGVLDEQAGWTVKQQG